MWENILGVERVGIHDDFFQLAGTHRWQHRYFPACVTAFTSILRCVTCLKARRSHRCARRNRRQCHIESAAPKKSVDGVLRELEGLSDKEAGLVLASRDQS